MWRSYKHTKWYILVFIVPMVFIGIYYGIFCTHGRKNRGRCLARFSFKYRNYYQGWYLNRVPWFSILWRYYGHAHIKGAPKYVSNTSSGMMFEAIKYFTNLYLTSSIYSYQLMITWFGDRIRTSLSSLFRKITVKKIIISVFVVIQTPKS